MQELLHQEGGKLNEWATEYSKCRIQQLASYDPWHVCFAIGLTWGHLAKTDDASSPAFTQACARLLAEWNNEDLSYARGEYLERGPNALEQSLLGGWMIFEKLTMPPSLPDTLVGLHQAQQRWLGRVLASDRPRYIGAWNSTALFMVALLSNSNLYPKLVDRSILLPLGGPIYRALRMLYEAHILGRPPAGGELDDAGFEPGALYENTALMEELHEGRSNWSMVDVHSGLYLLGTRQPLGT